MLSSDEEKKAAEAAKKVERETLDRGKAVLGTDKYGRGLSGQAADNLYSLQEEAVRDIEQSRKGGIVSQETAESPEYQEDRKQRAEQKSTNRRLIREINRAKATGRVSSWLQRYSAQKEAEFNSQNSTLQQTTTPTVSVTYSPANETPNTATVATQKKSTTSTINTVNSTANTPRHPWQVRLSTYENGNTLYLIEYNSNLYKGLSSFENIEITGLNFPVAISEGYVVLFGVVTDGECSNASIQFQTIPSDRIEFIDDMQNSFAVILAYLYQDENATWVVRQNAFHNLTLVDVCIDGKSAIYPIAT